jgi:hypothetical protein
VPNFHIGPLDFSNGLEDVAPARQDEHLGLPKSELLQPSRHGPASPVEELIGVSSFADAIEASIQPPIADMSICRPERYGALLAEAQDLLAATRRRTGSNAEIDELVSVLDRQNELRDLLGYYVQSLLSA